MLKKIGSSTVLIVALVAALFLSACGAGPSTQATATPEVQAPIKLGGTLPLTGAYADTGLWIERGYRYWAEQINERGGLLGRQVELVIYDDESDPAKSVDLLEKAISEDKVDLLVGGYPGTAAVLQMPVAEAHQMVYVSMGGHMPSFEQGFTFSFGGPPLMGQWWYEGFWQWAATLPEGDRPQQMAMMSVNNVVGLSVRESALDGAQRLGIEIVMDELYDLPLAAALDLVAQAKESGADLFLANGFLPDGVLTVQAMRALDYNPAFFLQGVGSLVPTWQEQLGEDGYYVFSGTPIHAKLPFEGIEAMNAYTERLYDTAEAPAYFMFGEVWLETLQAGVQGTSSLDQVTIRDYLKSHKIETSAGSFQFDERGLPQPYGYLTQVQPSGVELIWPLDVRSAEPIYPRPPWGGQ